jgi:superfamily II DNA or RNA helicase
LPTVILVQNKKPFKQVYDTLISATDIGDDVGYLDGTKKKFASVMVVSVPSLISGIKKENPAIMKMIKECKLLIIDEAHHIASDGHINCVERFSSTVARIALTATPGRADEREMYFDAYAGPVLDRITRAEAIDNKLTVPLTFFFENMPQVNLGFTDLRKTDIRKFNAKSKTMYMKTYEEQIVFNKYRNNRIAEFVSQANDDGLTVAVIVKLKTHAEELKAVIPYAEILMADNPDREEVFEALASKKIMCVITTLMEEASDVPSLDCVALAAGGDSWIKHEQRIRCDRIFPGKDRGYVYYPVDRCDFLKSHSANAVKLLSGIAHEHPSNAVIWVNG